MQMNPSTPGPTHGMSRPGRRIRRSAVAASPMVLLAERHPTAAIQMARYSDTAEAPTLVSDWVSIVVP